MYSLGVKHFTIHLLRKKLETYFTCYVKRLLCGKYQITSNILSFIIDKNKHSFNFLPTLWNIFEKSYYVRRFDKTGMKDSANYTISNWHSFLIIVENLTLFLMQSTLSHSKYFSDTRQVGLRKYYSIKMISYLNSKRSE